MNIEVDSNTKCFSQEEIYITSSTKKVYEIISDINKWPEWQSSVTKAEIMGKPEVGKTFKWKAGGLKINSRLHTVNPDSEIGWTGRIGWITAVHNWYLLAIREGTKVTVKESLRGFGSALMKKSLKEGMKKNLIELKNRAEKK